MKNDHERSAKAKNFYWKTHDNTLRHKHQGFFPNSVRQFNYYCTIVRGLA